VHVPASPDQLPRKTAIGSFMLALLMMRIVQLHAIQPRLPRDEGWTWMKARLRTMQHQEDGSASPSLDPQILVPVFELATRTTLESVCADAIAVATVCLLLLSLDFKHEHCPGHNVWAFLQPCWLAAIVPHLFFADHLHGNAEAKRCCC